MRLLWFCMGLGWGYVFMLLGHSIARQEMDDIKVGDLVMVVRGHECVINAVGGGAFVVLDIINQTCGGWYCPTCCTSDLGKDELLAAKLMADREGGIPLGWLKKIPPLAELEAVQSTEKKAQPMPAAAGM